MLTIITKMTLYMHMDNIIFPLRDVKLNISSCVYLATIMNIRSKFTYVKKKTLAKL